MDKINIPVEFTHLEVHSHFSLLGGTASVMQLAERAAADGLRALALTDNNALYGAVSFARACRAVGIKPIIGMTLSLAAPPDEVELETAVPGQLVLLATNSAGYRSLCALSSAVQGSAQRAALRHRGLDWETLRDHSSGLICLTGGRRGWLERYLRAGRRAAAVRFASRLGGIFQEQCFFSFSPDTGPGQAIAREAVATGERFGLRPAAVQPVFCLEPEQTPRLRLLAAIDQNCQLADVPDDVLPAFGDPTVPLHWHSPAALAERFNGHADALTNSAEIARRCGDVLPDGRSIWPVIPLADDLSAEDALVEQAYAGLEAHFAALAGGADDPLGGTPMATYEARLRHELAAIEQHDFAPLFLLVADITRFARAAAIPYNTRGSVANSLVAFCLGITNIDPMVHNLLFERFLNPARASLPDIDLDFCSRRRDEVLAYVRRTYGADRVALIATVSTMQPKSAVGETAKAYGLDEAAGKRLAALMPRHWHPDPRRRELPNLDDALSQLDDEMERDVLRAAYALIGQPHHLSIHPGGLVVTPGPLTNVVPVQMTPKGFLITQYDYRDVERIGLPKIDLLGIRALTVLADTAVAIRTHHDANFRLEDIPLNDRATGDLLSSGTTIGVFQCESEGAQRTLRQLKARTVGDLAVANAFFKPGPATGGMAKAFVRRYRGEEAVGFLHPALAPILRPTQGVLLFQEQVLRIAVEIAGLSWAEADHLRRGMSKFQPREMASMRLKFVSGCQSLASLTPEQADTLWEQVQAFAGYGFNQGHATAYAAVSYRSAFLKAHFPAEFLCARLADHGGFHHPAIYMAEAVRLGFAVRPPHVNAGGRKFTLQAGEPPTLWMGLGAVRDLRRKSVAAIVTQRRQRPFTSVRDLLARVALQQKEARHLIQCGALDGLGASRAAMLAEAQQIERAGSARQLAFGFAEATVVPSESPARRLAWESHILGLPVSVHPLALVEPPPDVVPLRAVVGRGHGRITTAGVRLPGWTGGKGFFLGDGDSFVIVKTGSEGRSGGKRPSWQPLRVTGHWVTDEWGGGWLAAADISRIESA